MDEFELLQIGAAFEIGNLPADHAARIDRLRDHLDRSYIPRPRQPRKRLGQQRVAGQDSYGLAIDDVGSLAAAAEIIVVERGKIVVDERVRVDQLERGTGNEQRLDR